MGNENARPIIKQDVVENLDLVRYSGQWFEIAKMPLIWEKACATAEASYEFDAKDQVMHVANICKSANQQELFRRTGVARRANPNSTDGKLRLNFTDGLPSDSESDYWVLFTDYESYTVVGNATKTQVWVLSRTVSMSTCLYRAILRKLHSEFGYDTKSILVNQKALSKCVHGA